VPVVIFERAACGRAIPVYGVTTCAIGCIVEDHATLLKVVQDGELTFVQYRWRNEARNIDIVTYDLRLDGRDVS
jgi:hypothetical protein